MLQGLIKVKGNAEVQAKELINQQVHSRINQKLTSKEKQIQDIQEKLRGKDSTIHNEDKSNGKL